MAKKKKQKRLSKKKDKKKKGIEKKGMKNKSKQKKKAKRKNAQKKEQKKKVKKKGSSTKNIVDQEVASAFSPPIAIEVPVLEETIVNEEEVQVEVEIPAEPVVTTSVDHSSNYNTKEGLAILRSLTKIEDIESFTEGEKRVTITRAISGIIKRLEAE